jgi:hypothetical protein
MGETRNANRIWCANYLAIVHLNTKHESDIVSCSAVLYKQTAFHLHHSVCNNPCQSLGFMQFSVLSEHEKDNFNHCTTDDKTFQFMIRLISLSSRGTGMSHNT